MPTNQKTLIAVPALKMVHTDFVTSLLRLNRIGPTNVMFSRSSMTYDGRNELAGAAMDGGFDRVLWIDSDMTFAPDFAQILAGDMESEDLDYISGLCFMRTLPTKPVINKRLEYDCHGDDVHIVSELYADYPRDSLFEIDASGFGGVMTSTRLIRRVCEKFGLPFTPMMGLGEDYSFCWRVKQLGVRMWCDSRAKMGHLATLAVTEEQYECQCRNQQARA